MKRFESYFINTTPRSIAAKRRSARHRFAWKNIMRRRGWIWIIPILAALSTIWIQAALHGFDIGDFAAQTTGQIEWRVAAPETTASHADKGLPYDSSPRPTE